jgi:hypothetical protein
LQFLKGLSIDKHVRKILKRETFKIMKTTFTNYSKPAVKSAFTIMICFSTPALFAQNIDDNTASISSTHLKNEPEHQSDSVSSNPHKVVIHTHSTSGTKKHPEQESKTIAVHHSALSTHKVFHHRTPATLTQDRLVTGHTYNRYGEKANPKGYGIQVVTFKKIKNLQRFLHTYHKKDMYIQVVLLDSSPNEQMYRVILGADENKSLIEQELTIFQHAGVPAVLRKHKATAE